MGRIPSGSDMKPSLPGVAVVVTAVAIVAVGSVAGIALSHRSARQYREMLKHFNMNSEGILKYVRKDDRVEGAAEQARQIQDAMGQTASKLTGDSAKAFRGGERLMASMQFEIAAYENSYSAFLSHGGLAPGSLVSVDVIGERLALLTAFEAANKSYKDFLQGAEGKFRQKLSKEECPPSQIDETVRGFRETSSIDTQLAIRDTDAELCVAMESYLLLLKSEWGKWKVNEAGSIVFENSDATAAFNGCSKRMSDVANRQAELQKNVVRARERALGPLEPSIFGTR
jgi:hypothetical protein